MLYSALTHNSEYPMSNLTNIISLFTARKDDYDASTQCIFNELPVLREGIVEYMELEPGDDVEWKQVELLGDKLAIIADVGELHNPNGFIKRVTVVLPFDSLEYTTTSQVVDMLVSLESDDIDVDDDSLDDIEHEDIQTSEDLWGSSAFYNKGTLH